MLHCLTRGRHVVLVVARAVGNRCTSVGESQRNLWLQAGHLKYTDTKPITLLTTHTCSVT